jgi:hypothetical protein
MAMMPKGPIRMGKRAAMAAPASRQMMPQAPALPGSTMPGGMKKGGKVKGKKC